MSVPRRHLLIPAGALAALSCVGGLAIADARRPDPTVGTARAAAAPQSFMARAQGDERRGQVRIRVSAWDANGRALRRVRVEVRRPGRAMSLCGTTDAQGRTACRVPAAGPRPEVYASNRGVRRVRVRFFRYRGG
jgi:hypothetical protein